MSEIKKQEANIETTKGLIEDRIRIINKFEELLIERQNEIDNQLLILNEYNKRLEEQTERLEQLKNNLKLDTALGKIRV